MISELSPDDFGKCYLIRADIYINGMAQVYEMEGEFVAIGEINYRPLYRFKTMQGGHYETTDLEDLIKQTNLWKTPHKSSEKHV